MAQLDEFVGEFGRLVVLCPCSTGANEDYLRGSTEEMKNLAIEVGGETLGAPINIDLAVEGDHHVDAQRLGAGGRVGPEQLQVVVGAVTGCRHRTQCHVRVACFTSKVP